MKGEPVYVSVKARHGDYDNKLKWPFVGNIIVTLVDSRENSQDLSKTFRFLPSYGVRPGGMCSGGLIPFVPHSKIQWFGSPSYLRHLDTLTFYVYY